MVTLLSHDALVSYHNNLCASDVFFSYTLHNGTILSLSLHVNLDSLNLSFLKGDMFIVHNELDDGWMWVTNVRTEEQGLIVEDLVEEVVSTARVHQTI